jgi:quinoprotein dehydrogenase-associated probable ABC transporter substrate-binding protein
MRRARRRSDVPDGVAPAGASARALSLALLACVAFASTAGAENAPAGDVLKVCADPNNLPQSDRTGAGYENKLAEALAKDLGRKVEYTFFPQRIGFVRHTLRSQDEQTGKFRCDVIIGVPRGYELAATTQSYMRSIYALVMPGREEFRKLKTAEDLLTLPPETLKKLRIGVFTRSPAMDWMQRHGLITQAHYYQAQSGDPDEHPASVVERDLTAGNIDLAIVWGPVAGFLAERHKSGNAWLSVPFKPDPSFKFDYEMAMGVRFGEKEWKDTLDRWIATHQDVIRNILANYRVPLLDTVPPKVSALSEGRSDAQ